MLAGCISVYDDRVAVADHIGVDALTYGARITVQFSGCVCIGPINISRIIDGLVYAHVAVIDVVYEVSVLMWVPSITVLPVIIIVVGP